MMDLDYYSSHSSFTDPGKQADLFNDLPSALEELIEVVQGLLIHRSVVEHYGVQLTPSQRSEQYLRTIEHRLGRLAEVSAGPLTLARPPAERQVGCCRDFALLLVAMLRAQGRPARMRVGFASYLAPGTPYFSDHWVTEVWDVAEARWVLVDAQIDEIQRRDFHITVDTTDLVSGTDFTPAGPIWQRCRQGEAQSILYRFNGHWKGFPCIRNNLLNDFQAMNKVELTPWDCFDQLSQRSEAQLTVEDKALLDRIAALTGNDERFEEMQSLYDALPRTREIDAKLLTLGIGALRRLVSPGDLRPSPAGMIAALGSPAAPQMVPAPPLVYTPYEIPADSSLAMLVRQEETGSAFGGGEIVVRGARQHNLKHIDVRIPRNKLVVITGVSGSGKSSLAFDTIYAEGQRRYVESLSSYARQFMGQMEKPQVDQITGLSPAVAIEQKTISRNPRSTVGTVTEILDYLRVLYARLGLAHCPQCGRAVQPQSAAQITSQLQRLLPGTRFQLLAPLARSRKGAYQAALKQARQDGFSRARIDGETVELDRKTALPELDKNKKHTIEVIVDRLEVPADPNVLDFATRLADSVETALKTGAGLLVVDLGSDSFLLSEHHACPACDLSFPELQPPLFSFNSPLGMCPDCNGLGVKLQVDPGLVIANPQLSLLEGASAWFRDLRKKGEHTWQINQLRSIAVHYGVDLDKPWDELPESFQKVILYGTGDEKVRFEFASRDGSFRGESTHEYKGIVYNINRLFRQTHSEYTRQYYMSFMNQLPCPACQGERLCPEARFVTVDGKRLPELTSFSIAALYDWIASLPPRLDGEQLQIGGELLEEIRQRLGFMRNVGLHYLNLDRPAPTLSGGEGQRIRLASQIGSGLVGVLYILDEPSIGLHARDHRALLDTLIQLRNLGNTVLVVEHDAETMRTADYLIDLGPGPGVLGGELVAAGTPEEVMRNPDSLTGCYLSGELKVLAPNGHTRRNSNGWVTVRNASLHNLKHIDARFPLGALTCITGVSGSGKSSLIAQTLYPALERSLQHAQSVPSPHDGIDGLEQLDKVINITQDPIGRNPRSNPGTYVGVLSDIRKIFATMPEARALGFNPDRFSFNVKGGRCEACAGYGYKKIEMHFLADVWVRCKECEGQRFNRQTLAITYKDRSIAEVLAMDVQEALEFFAVHPSIRRMLQTLHDVGLDYIKLGQSATTLSGGEAQRVKLAKELSRVSTGRTLYILDEPTTGLHFADVQRLLDVLHRLVEAGNTVLVIEHNLDVVRAADWILDLGPEGGEQGGYIVAEGTPEQVAGIDISHTGKVLSEIRS
jgi:excinuclease ABC subunit A